MAAKPPVSIDNKKISVILVKPSYIFCVNSINVNEPLKYPIIPANNVPISNVENTLTPTTANTITKM